MSWSKRCYRLRQPATALIHPRRRPAFILSSVSRRTFADSKQSTSLVQTSSSSLTPASTKETFEEDKPSSSGVPDQRFGSLAKNSIFQQETARTRSRVNVRDGTRNLIRPPLLANRDPAAMAAVLDPRPRARIRFERKMVIQELRRRGRLTKEQLLKRTERQYMRKSEYYKTGMKKVAPLARQIAGKTIDEAILQMQFSKKKAAAWIHDHLVATKNRAIVERGMGLGDNEGPKKREVLKMELKDGSKHKVSDPTGMYIDQAWVNKGPYGKAFSKRARGRIDTLRLPQTNLTIQLKEEKTRIREWQERRDKEDRKRPWMQLPNRSVSTQRPYYCW